jgi:hypothetical protein
MSKDAALSIAKEGLGTQRNKNFRYSLLDRYLFILGRQNFDFLAAGAEITDQPKNKQITTEGISCTTGLYKLPGLP